VYWSRVNNIRRKHKTVYTISEISSLYGVFNALFVFVLFLFHTLRLQRTTVKAYCMPSFPVHLSVHWLYYYIFNEINGDEKKQLYSWQMNIRLQIMNSTSIVNLSVLYNNVQCAESAKVLSLVNRELYSPASNVITSKVVMFECLPTRCTGSWKKYPRWNFWQFSQQSLGIFEAKFLQTHLFIQCAHKSHQHGLS